MSTVRGQLAPPAACYCHKQPPRPLVSAQDDNGTLKAKVEGGMLRLQVGACARTRVRVAWGRAQGPCGCWCAMGHGLLPAACCLVSWAAHGCAFWDAACHAPHPWPPCYLCCGCCVLLAAC